MKLNLNIQRLQFAKSNTSKSASTSRASSLQTAKVDTSTSRASSQQTARLDTVIRPEASLVDSFRENCKGFNPGGVLCW